MLLLCLGLETPKLGKRVGRDCSNDGFWTGVGYGGAGGVIIGLVGTLVLACSFGFVRTIFRKLMGGRRSKRQYRSNNSAKVENTGKGAKVSFEDDSDEEILYPNSGSVN